MTKNAKGRWPWRTWDKLAQTEAATDGKSPEQRAGITKMRGLGLAETPTTRTLLRHGLIECIDSAETVGADGYGLVDSKGREVVRNIYVITAEGRKVLHSAVGSKAKREAGVEIREPE